MKQKENKTFYEQQLKPFLNNNQLLLAALGGVAIGIAIASLLGSEKAKEVFESVQSNVKQFSNKVAEGINTSIASTKENLVGKVEEVVPAS